MPEIPVEEFVREVIRKRAAAIDRVCAVALLDGRYGVHVGQHRVWIDPEIPAGMIYYDPTPVVADWGVTTWTFTSDPRLPEERDA